MLLMSKAKKGGIFMKILNTYRRLHVEIATDDPLTFNDLSLECQLALLAWIGYAIVEVGKKNSRSSDDIRHDFEHVGFVVSNGTFNGAMLASGYKPGQRQGG